MTRFAYDDQLASMPAVVAEIIARTEWPRLDMGQPILFAGIGSSLHAARVAADWVTQLTSGKVRALGVDAHDLGASALPILRDRPGQPSCRCAQSEGTSTMSDYVGILEGGGGNWGVRIFDIDGCVGAGTTAEEAIATATEALRDVVAYKRSGNHPVPSPSGLAHVMASGEVRAGERAILIPLTIDAG